jgi:hypothetical protein
MLYYSLQMPLFRNDNAKRCREMLSVTMRFVVQMMWMTRGPRTALVLDRSQIPLVGLERDHIASELPRNRMGKVER